MTAQTIVASLPQSQSLLVQQRSYKVAAKPQVSLINPSRSITAKDEAYLRDYALAAAILSWDECTYGTPEQITAADITNIALAGDTVWYQIQLHRAIPIDIETFQAHRLQIQQHSCEEVPTAQPPLQQAQANSKAIKQAQQPAGDSAGCQLRLDWEAVAEYESGIAHGRLDAANRMPTICTEASCPYSEGYLTGYNEIERSHPQPESVAPPQWSVTWNATWQWYEVWVGDAWVGRASNHEEAERIAQKYKAAEELRTAHRELVLAAFAP